MNDPAFVAERIQHAEFALRELKKSLRGAEGNRDILEERYAFLILQSRWCQRKRRREDDVDDDQQGAIKSKTASVGAIKSETASSSTSPVH